MSQKYKYIYLNYNILSCDVMAADLFPYLLFSDPWVYITIYILGINYNILDY